MKHLKKLLFTAVLAAALSTSVFAASGFEFILNVPLGMGINLLPTFSYINNVAKPNGNEILRVNYNSEKRLGFDTGVSAQIGYMWQVVNNFWISLLGEVGYSFDSLYGVYKFDSADAGAVSPIPSESEINVSVYSHTLKVGLLPKFNINAFSIGIGGGVSIPMSVSQSISLSDGSKGNYPNIKLSIPIGFYAKLTLDYSIFFTDNIALNIGLYTRFDYINSIKTVITGNPEHVGSQYFDTPFVTYDIGLQVGFRFWPKAFN